MFSFVVISDIRVSISACYVNIVFLKGETSTCTTSVRMAEITQMKPVGELRAQLQPQLGLAFDLIVVPACALSYTHTHTKLMQLIAPVIALFSHQANECRPLSSNFSLTPLLPHSG